MQAGACSIRSRLQCSHGWLCSIRSHLRCSHSALLIHYKKVWLKKKLTSPEFEPTQSDFQAGCSITTANWTYLVYIFNCVWAAVLQECRWSFGKNRLHPGIQSAVDGERLGLRAFKNKLRVPRRWALHLDQVRRWYLHPRQRSTRLKNCRRTDGRLFSRRIKPNAIFKCTVQSHVSS